MLLLIVVIKMLKNWVDIAIHNPLKQLIMNTTLSVENIKCGGCANSIRSRLSNLVSAVEVDVENGNISFSYTTEDELDQVISALEKMGYPRMGTSRFSHKAKSYVSCMIGRVRK